MPRLTLTQSLFQLFVELRIGSRGRKEGTAARVDRRGTASAVRLRDFRCDILRRAGGARSAAKRGIHGRKRESKYGYNCI